MVDAARRPCAESDVLTGDDFMYPLPTFGHPDVTVA
jgi:hypothetical protein